MLKADIENTLITFVAQHEGMSGLVAAAYDQSSPIDPNVSSRHPKHVIQVFVDSEQSDVYRYYVQKGWYAAYDVCPRLADPISEALVLGLRPNSNNQVDINELLNGLTASAPGTSLEEAMAAFKIVQNAIPCSSGECLEYNIRITLRLSDTDSGGYRLYALHDRQLGFVLFEFYPTASCS